MELGLNEWEWNTDGRGTETTVHISLMVMTGLGFRTTDRYPKFVARQYHIRGIRHGGAHLS